MVNTRSERDIIILAPATKGVEEENWVLVSLFDELFTSVLEQENVTVVKRVAYLEGVYGISTTSFDEITDFAGSVSVLVHAIVESDAFGEVHVGA